MSRLREILPYRRGRWLIPTSVYDRRYFCMDCRREAGSVLHECVPGLSPVLPISEEDAERLTKT